MCLATSWGYFSQPFHWRADSGCRGDWQVEDHLLTVDAEFAGKASDETCRAGYGCRNVVKEMTANLRAIKPVRQPLQELQKATLIRLVLG